MNIEDKITTTKNLESIAVNAIFSQILNTDPAQGIQEHTRKCNSKGATRFLAKGQ